MVKGYLIIMFGITGIILFIISMMLDGYIIKNLDNLSVDRMMKYNVISWMLWVLGLLLWFSCLVIYVDVCI